ncbi:DUF6788 family protein [Halosimplex salinum]|uniref:DUF6788 family protein n=1 Tax=Halosimplex salinum TaxID=1710538 RepID=UPI000F49F834|nr:DUF6788 family protein [Halosimplex salinum]
MGTNGPPPEELPKYLAEGIPKQDVSTLKAAREYIDELIATRERPVDVDELPEAAEPIEEAPEGYVVEELVSCGKDGCRCASGADEDLHGPYRYRYYRDENGNLQKKYAENE